MKTLFSFLAIAALVLTSSFTVSEQQKLNEQSSAMFNCFNYVRAHRQGKNVVVNWSATDPSIVQFTVERSYDGEFFDPAGGQGAAGSRAYKFTDMGVFPGTIYYRIVALKGDGTTECSPVETVRIVSRG